jgi:CxxC motif-containing protein (DUF1111 family)
LILKAGEAPKPATERSQASARDPASGAEIFRREWVAADPRSHGGDGLGPVFNETSCVACHNQGGVGGGGSLEKNIQLMTANLPALENLKFPAGDAKKAAQMRKQMEQQLEASRQALARMHPGFRDSSTVVVHKFGIDPAHENWRKMLARSNTQVSAQAAPNNSVANGFPGISTSPRRVDVTSTGQTTFLGPAQALRTANPFPLVGKIQSEIQILKGQAKSLSTSLPVPLGSVQVSQRNTTALFGSGVIDEIPAEAIEAAAKRKHAGFPEVSGRVHRLADGRIGRFGWKAQKPSLYDFTIAACAVEVGLNVPGHAQASAPYKQQEEETTPAGFDLNRDEVLSLVDYLKELPAPKQRMSSHPDVGRRIDDGEKLFAEVGCAACHVKTMGKAQGLFSDLLLHDMGPDLGSVGSYGVPVTPSPDPQDPPESRQAGTDAPPKVIPPTAQEWRTPPLWGVRDSAPYLHDGRAATLDQAIALHGGEAARSRLQFFLKTQEERQKIMQFLKSLSAPDTVADAGPSRKAP